MSAQPPWRRWAPPCPSRQLRERAARATVLGRLGDPAEAAAAVAYLASDDASYVTASLLVDGGWSVVKDSP